MYPIRNYNIKSSYECPTLDTEKKSNLSAFYCPIDVDTSKSFTRNLGGHVRSDLAVINETQSIEVAKDLINRLDQRSGDGFDSKQFSDADILLSAKSRYCQAPSEIASFINDTLDKQYQRDMKSADAAKIKQLEEEREKRIEVLKNSLSADERKLLVDKQREKDIEEIIDNV